MGVVLSFLAKLRRALAPKPVTTIEISFSGTADEAFTRAFMEILRQGAIRTRHDDDEPPPVPI